MEELTPARWLAAGQFAADLDPPKSLLCQHRAAIEPATGKTFGNQEVGPPSRDEHRQAVVNIAQGNQINRAERV